MIGHAVGAFVTKVTVDEGHSGIAWIRLPGDDSPPALLARREMIALLSVHMAETIAMLERMGTELPVAKLLARTTVGYIDGKGRAEPRSGMPRVAQLAMVLAGDREVAEQLIVSVADETETMLREQWPAVSVVAEAVVVMDPTHRRSVPPAHPSMG